MSTGQFHGWYIIGALANDFAAVGVDQAISRARAFEKSPNHFLIVPRPGFRAPTDNLTTFSNPFSGASRTLPKPQGKHEKVRFLSSPLKNPGFPRVFRISGQLLWSSVAPMQLGAWRIAALYFASRTENRVVFRVARVAKTLGSCMSRSGQDPRPWWR
jgi:hypothetical protein